MLHRMDGKLVAFSVLAIAKTLMSTLYFVFDPDYAFLKLGVISVTKEIEFMRHLNEKYNYGLKYLILGDLQVNCKKLSYKMNYGPAEILDPFTLKWHPFSTEVKERIKEISMMSLEEKKAAPHLSFDKHRTA